MIPIHQLLSRIRWDREFARGDFAIGYFDRVADAVIEVPLRKVEFPADKPQAFRVFDEDGEAHDVPFHRVREVFKDGHRIWCRPPVRRSEP